MKITRYRDLSLININKNQTMVIACDSAGGIGSKENDIVKVPPHIVGYFTCQVPLKEILSVGGEVITIVDTLSVEMDDTGREIIKGIKRAIEPLDIDEDVILTGSTEENFPVCQTGVGITAIGIINDENWEIPKSHRGDLIISIGLPKVGEEVIKDNGKIITLPIIKELYSKSYVKEIIPVGSKGIIHEINEICKNNKLKYELYENIKVDINKSAGPATCGIVTIDKDFYNELIENFSVPINILGKIL